MGRTGGRRPGTQQQRLCWPPVLSAAPRLHQEAPDAPRRQGSFPRRRLSRSQDSGLRELGHSLSTRSARRGPPLPADLPDHVRRLILPMTSQ